MQLPDLTYSNIEIGGSAHVHLGSILNSYAVEGSVQISQADIESLTGPLNVSTAAQGLILLSTKFLVELGRGSPLQRHGGLYCAVDLFRKLLRRVLPASLLSTMTQKRAALIPAVDLVALLTETVLIFAEIEESLSASLDGSTDSVQETTLHNADMARQLDIVSEILSMYDSIMSTKSTEDAVAMSESAHRAAAQLANTRLPSRPSLSRSEGTCRKPFRNAETWGEAHHTSAPAQESKLFTGASSAVAEDEGLQSAGADARLHAWTRAFEIELFRSRVYSNLRDVDQTISSMTSSFSNAASTILPLLSLADVSIVSVLRLPVRLQALCNADAYVLTTYDADEEIATADTYFQGCLDDVHKVRVAYRAATARRMSS
ncbi:hypothetical protein B0A48_08468 [Cryoendolithus antarcticus]|uniref:Uncharacterized protein n=1 Tax=Cryoendolithus antarcticus TaxID=1507870 RepID=A0A1V8T5Z3_9PEZI|nr:hypothetical protein B0A48_08468 [Cryoendolithus antarcticus]